MSAETEQELLFDPTMKKKKKKKKKLADLDDEIPDAADGEAAPDAAAAAATAPASAAAAATGEVTVNATAPQSKSVLACLAAAARVSAPLEEAFLASLMAGELELKSMKKKKKRARTAEEAAAEEELLDEFSLDSKKKKKKKAKKVADLDDNLEEPSTPAEAEEDDKDYTYKEMLDRVFAIMRANNPELVSGEKKRFVMKPPQVVRLGSKKSGFANFLDICKMLHRQPDHLLAFLLAELGTSGSLDASNCLVIKGRFTQKNIESVLRKYIRDYVTCHTCKSPTTILAKHSRLYFLQCETCGSRCSVASIKSGFQAVTAKRSKLRAKAQ